MRRVDLIGPFVLIVSIGAVATCVTSGSDDDSPAHQALRQAAQTSASPPGAPSVQPTSASDVVGLLDQSSEAALDMSYQGQQVVSSWRATGTQTLTLDVSHQPGVGTVVRVAGSDGTGSAVMQADTDIFDPTGALSLLLQHYDCTDDGESTVAGRATSVVDVRRPNAAGAATGPLVARFWIDADRADVAARGVRRCRPDRRNESVRHAEHVGPGRRYVRCRRRVRYTNTNTNTNTTNTNTTNTNTTDADADADRVSVAARLESGDVECPTGQPSLGGLGTAGPTRRPDAL